MTTVTIHQLTLQEEILEELAFDPRIDADDIAVAIHEGIVTLRGSVPSLSQKRAIEKTVKGVRGIRGLVDELVVDLPEAHVRNDTDIAVAIKHRFASNGVLPAEALQIVVAQGHVTLEGAVQWYYQAHEAVHEASCVTGVTGVTNGITVKNLDSVSADEVRRRIHSSLQRAADLDANCITVTVDGGTVTLAGIVRTWLEHEKAAQAAWSIPGVSRVDNSVTISGI